MEAFSIEDFSSEDFPAEAFSAGSFFLLDWGLALADFDIQYRSGIDTKVGLKNGQLHHVELTTEANSNNVHRRHRLNSKLGIQ